MIRTLLFSLYLVCPLICSAETMNYLKDNRFTVISMQQLSEYIYTEKALQKPFSQQPQDKPKSDKAPK